MDKVKIAIIDSGVKNIIVRGVYQAAVKAVILLKKSSIYADYAGGKVELIIYIDT